MRRQETRSVDDDSPGAPEWMVTFSDCMTLLLTFFVLLLSFSSFDEDVFQKLKVIFAKELPSVSPVIKRAREAFVETVQIEPGYALDEGSEKPTLAKNVDDRLKKETESIDFRERKVFLFSSKNIFWGNGSIISHQGRKTLSSMAAFLKEVPNRIVISEGRTNQDADSEHSGLIRSWEVLNYFTQKEGLEKGWFSISAGGIAGDNSWQQPGKKIDRMLEIVLLERSVYN